MHRGFICQVTTKILVHLHLLHHYSQQAKFEPVVHVLDACVDKRYTPNRKIFKHKEDQNYSICIQADRTSGHHVQ